MWTKQRQGLTGICLICFMAVALLNFLLLPAWGAEVKNEKIGQQSGKIYLQERFQASRIIDQTIKNDRGGEVGEVDDLIMSRTGKIKKVILSVGGFLGIGDRLVAVPFKSLKISEKGDIIKVGDYVLVHAGFAIQKVDEEAANDPLNFFEEIAECLDQENTPL